ncbi:MAG: AbgT family transporter [Oscillospiraceae bacterium]|nr:AbgT family transporter [Oscillospiraceae bacterium]
MSKKPNEKVSLYNRALNGIERVGNSLPHPILLFAILALAIVVISAVCAALGVSATGELISGGELRETTVSVVSLLTRDGLQYMFTKAVSNFTSYAPLGMVLVAMLGVGVAEQSGMINALLKRAVKATPAKLLTPMIVFLGVMSNIASDAGYVILIPLGAMMFRACGRHPIAGLAAAFAGVSGGFSANLLIGTLDPLLAGISQAAVSIIDPGYTVQVMGNYIFMCASTFLITILGTIITDKIVEPRLQSFGGQLEAEEDASLTTVTEEEKKGLRNAGIAALIFVAVIVACCIPRNSFFKNDAGELLGNTPFVNSIVVLIALLFFIPGAAYGLSVGTFRNSSDVCNAMSKAMAGMGSFLALAFVSAQFINYFTYTNLGTIIALTGAEFFKSVNIGLIPLMVIFVLFSAFMNLFMGSASAKWNILAPVFVPMFMLLGYSPELCQLAYRIGDSCTNIITPMMTYYAVIIIFAQRYDKKAGIGTITATMLPYSVCFLICWTIMLILWLTLGLPIGVNTPLFYPAV